MANMSVHTLLTSMSPWGTLNDQELIDLEEDEDEDVTPIWKGFNVEGMTPVDMVNAFTKRISDIFEILKVGEDGLDTEKGSKLMEGIKDESFKMKIPHAISMAIDDHIEGEVGFEAQCNEEGEDMETHFHK